MSGGGGRATARSPVALVTGGTQGIGRACVRALRDDGFEVVFAGRDASAGAEVEEELAGSTFVQADVTDPVAVERLVSVAEELGDGRLDALVNNAGICRPGRLEEGSVGDWDYHFDGNARSVYLVTRAAIEALDRAEGAVVTISSIAGMVGETGLSSYTASKAAVIGLSQTLAIERGARVRFNCVCPGEIATSMMAQELADPVRGEAIVKSIPARRVGEAAEVAAVVAFLVSRSASFVNGAVIPVDGGKTAGIGPREG